MQMGQRPDLRSAWRRGRYVVWNQRRILGEMPILEESDWKQTVEREIPPMRQIALPKLPNLLVCLANLLKRR